VREIRPTKPLTITLLNPRAPIPMDPSSPELYVPPTEHHVDDDVAPASPAINSRAARCRRAGKSSRIVKQGVRFKDSAREPEIITSGWRVSLTSVSKKCEVDGDVPPRSAPSVPACASVEACPDIQSVINTFVNRIDQICDSRASRVSKADRVILKAAVAMIQETDVVKSK
jgi:hypothetical protein